MDQFELTSTLYNVTYVVTSVGPENVTDGIYDEPRYRLHIPWYLKLIVIMALLVGLVVRVQASLG